AALRKQTTKQTDDGLPVHSFHSLIADLATLTRNTVTTAISPSAVPSNHPARSQIIVSDQWAVQFKRRKLSLVVPRKKLRGSETGRIAHYLYIVLQETL
ncbi:hypothetical protein, partial [Acidiphilium iwatense]